MDQAFNRIEYQKARVFFLVPNWKKQFSYLVTEEGISCSKPGNINPARTESYKVGEVPIIKTQDSHLPNLPNAASVNSFMKTINSSTVSGYGKFPLVQSEDLR